MNNRKKLKRKNHQPKRIMKEVKVKKDFLLFKSLLHKLKEVKFDHKHFYILRLSFYQTLNTLNCRNKRKTKKSH